MFQEENDAADPVVSKTGDVEESRNNCRRHELDSVRADGKCIHMDRSMASSLFLTERKAGYRE